MTLQRMDNVGIVVESLDAAISVEMLHSIFVVGDHQWHRGYAVVALKKHVREPYDLPPEEQGKHFREVMRAAEAIAKTFRPVK